MKTKLKNIVEIQFGLYQRPDKKGDTAYLQGRHFDSNGIFREDEPLQFINYNQNMDKYILKDGDLLLAAKGIRNTASVFKSKLVLKVKLDKAAASSTFFILRVDPQKISSEYLAFYLNLTKTQKFFQSRSTGTNVPSLKRNVLEEIEILIPSIEVQNKLIELKSLWEKEKQLTEELLTKKEILYQEFFNNIIEGKLQ